MGMVDYVGRSRKRVIVGDIPNWVKNRGKSAGYIARVIVSAPPWVDRWELYALKHFAKALSIFTGVPHNLDHKVPLKHPDVCGLTVPWNLQIITWRQNMAKSNKWNPHQLELFNDEAGLPIVQVQAADSGLDCACQHDHRDLPGTGVHLERAADLLPARGPRADPEHGAELQGRCVSA